MFKLLLVVFIFKVGVLIVNFLGIWCVIGFEMNFGGLLFIFKIVIVMLDMVMCCELFILICRV